MARPLQLSYHTPPPPAVIRNSRCGTVLHGFDDTPLSAAVRLGAGLVERYERGEVLAFNSVDLGMTPDDWRLVDSIKARPTTDNWFKKAKYPALVAPLVAGVPHVLDHLLPDSRDDAARMRELIARVSDLLRKTVRTMFPGYRVVGESVTWRLTPTESEAMHFDSYGQGDDQLHHVRLFVNLDSAPRLWGVGPTVRDAVTTYRDRVRPFEHLNANQFNNGLNSHLPWPEVARHYVAFAPGNAWLVNSQVVAHEIVYGNKMIACTFDVKAGDMLDQAMFFPNVVATALRETPR